MIEFETPKEQKESSMKKALEKLENGGYETLKTLMNIKDYAWNVKLEF